MTEKEKMLKQQLYDANHDTDLKLERVKAKELCHQYNQLSPADEQGQQKILYQLLGKMGANCCITAPFWCDYGTILNWEKTFTQTITLSSSIAER